MRRLDNWLKAYMQYTANSESPEKIHFWVGVSTIAGALRRQVWLDMDHFDWTPNFYIVIVAPPGIVSKSTSIKIGMNLLQEVKGVQFGPDSITWQALITSLANAKKAVPINGDQYLYMSCLTIAPGELGTFADLNDKRMVDTLVSLWDGQKGSWGKETKTSGSDEIINPWLNIISATTPSWIEDNFPKYMIGGGFTSRTIWIYADSKRSLIAYPRRLVDAEHNTLKQDLIHDLRQISKLRGEYTLSKEAEQFGEEWYGHHYKETTLNIKPSYAGHSARKQTQLHKLAMVLAAADSDILVLEKNHLETAAKILDSIEPDLPLIFGGVGANDFNQKTNMVLDIIKKLQKVERTDLFRMVMRTVSWEEFERAIEAGLKSKKVHPLGAGGRIYFQWCE